MASIASKKSHVANLQGTNGVHPRVLSIIRFPDQSIVSKRSAENCGYFVDGFLKFFVQKPARRAAVINRIYFARWSNFSLSGNIEDWQFSHQRALTTAFANFVSAAVSRLSFWAAALIPVFYDWAQSILRRHIATSNWICPLWSPGTRTIDESQQHFGSHPPPLSADIFCS